MPDVVIIEQNENSPSYRVHPVYNESTAHIQKMVLEQNDKYEYQYRVKQINKEFIFNLVYFSYMIKIGLQIIIIIIFQLIVKFYFKDFFSLNFLLFSL